MNFKSEIVEDYGIYIDKDKEIYPYISQEEIFELVLGYLPKTFEKIISPIRKDSNPGCWLEYDELGELYFKDFAFGDKPLNSIGLFMYYKQLPSYYDALFYIKNTIIGDKISDCNLSVRKEKIQIYKKSKTVILTHKRDFNKTDEDYWNQYGISLKSLIVDNVFPIDKFRIISEKKGTDIIYTCNRLTYSIEGFKHGKKKLYIPFADKDKRFITNCSNNDIGGGIPCTPSLIITKSYKDYRVLKNLGYYSVWFQNEGQIPVDYLLIKLLQNKDSIFILYDNDETGKLQSEKLKDKLLLFNKNIKKVFVPYTENVKDISDYYKKYGEIRTINLLLNIIKKHEK